LTPGFDLFARDARLKTQLRWSDAVITGEGAIDASTFMGKAAGQIAAWCARTKLPCVGVCGAKLVTNRNRFTELHALTDLTTAKAATRRAAFWLERLANQVAHGW